MSRKMVHIDPTFTRRGYQAKPGGAPLRGNQLAAALQKAGVKPAEEAQGDIKITLSDEGSVEFEATDHPAPPSEPAVPEAAPSEPVGDAAPVLLPDGPAQPPPQLPVDRILTDVRAWMTRLVAGERIPVMQITEAIAHHARGKLVHAFVQKGLADVGHGRWGGARATPRLMLLARENVTDEQLAAILWPTESETSAPEPAPPEPEVEEEPEPERYTPPRLGPVPKGATARKGRLLADVLRWLHAAADGKRTHIGQLTTAGDAYRLGRKLQDAGLIERHERVGGGPGAVWYEITPEKVDDVRAMTVEQLAETLWSTVAPDDAGEEPAQEEAPAGQPGEFDPFALLAQRLGEITEMLIRIDARMARFERELGIKPDGSKA